MENRRTVRQGFDTIPTSDESPRPGRKPSLLFGTRESIENRRERILRTSQLGDDSGRGTRNENASNDNSPRSTMTTMRDVLRTVHFNLDMDSPHFGPLDGASDSFQVSEFFSIRSHQTVQNSSLGDDQHVRKPSFALRVLVQERFAEIIATDVAGYQDSIEIKDQTLSVSISSLKRTADRWKVPRRARKAFRAVAFEVLFFIGEYGLVTRGADALYDLSPLVFHGLFAPLLAALGDAEMMEAWLAQTQVLADVDLRKRTPITPRVSNEGRSAESGDPLQPHP